MKFKNISAWNLQRKKKKEKIFLSTAVFAFHLQMQGNISTFKRRKLLNLPIVSSHIVSLRVNGDIHPLSLDPRVLLKLEQKERNFFSLFP